MQCLNVVLHDLSLPLDLPCRLIDRNLQASRRLDHSVQAKLSRFDDIESLRWLAHVVDGVAGLEENLLDGRIVEHYHFCARPFSE